MMSHKPRSEQPSINEIKHWQLVNVNILSAESSPGPIRLGVSWIQDMATQRLQLAAKLPHF